MRNLATTCAYLCAGVWLLFTATGRGAEPLIVRVPASGCHDADLYFVELLHLALKGTVDTHGPYRIVTADIDVPVPERGMRLLRDGHGIDVAWLQTDPELEKQLQVIRIPLLRGLSGCRLLLIRKESQESFAAIDQLAALQDMRAGHMAGDPQGAILRANSIEVADGRDLQSLLSMLRKDRFDFLPLSICSPLLVTKTDGFVVEQHLLLWYPTAIYYFLPPQHAELAERLSAGLTGAISDGSFEELFLRHHGDYCKELLTGKRNVIRLRNPRLPEATPLHDNSLWINPEAGLAFRE